MEVTSETQERAELRLALVCYGGVSLAVYMHGVTKELQSLIRAARAFDDDAPERLDGSRHRYRARLLRRPCRI